MKKVYVIDASDNVGSAVLESLSAGDAVETNGAVSMQLKANSDVPFGHKIALVDIPKGGTVMKYALSIGSATQDIKKGDHVHIHNVESNRGRGDKFADAKGISA